MTHTQSTGYDMAIIGGGPSGLMAAQCLAEMGHSVTIYDKMSSLGRKFLLAGRGGLNLTHTEAIEPFLGRYGADREWMAPMLADFTPQDAQVWARDLGQELFVGTSGRVFPKAMKASPLLRAWLTRLRDLGVQVRLGMNWRGWRADGALLLVDGATGAEVSLQPDATLLALGGGSWARMGSDGAWVEALAAKGVAITPLQPSNCGVEVAWSTHFSQRFVGAPLKALAVSCGGAIARGDAIVTARGLEGGAIYGLGPAVRAGLAAGVAHLQLDLRPDQETVALAQKLVTAKAGQSLSSALKGKLNLSSAAIGLLREACGNDLPTSAMGLARLIKAVPIAVTGLAPMARAISSAGGIEQGALTPDLMLRDLQGVFAAGEMLDWDAPTGGYLLQACLATGHRAAKGMDAWVRSRAV
ncbi:MAG: hypothetical protein RL186_1572 [Pseudomonadota bacterium]